MNATSAPRRARVIVSSTAVAGLFLAGAAVTTAPAQSAAPSAGSVVEDCAEPFPVADVADGDAVKGLTVVKETTPTPFTGEVIGVLQDGIAPDLDMVMVRLSSDEIDRVGGIWQGMSGSPVYAEDDRLIGAVAYGMSWGPSPVAGVTPFEDMDDYLAASRPARVEVSKAEARSIARQTDVTAAQAEEGFDQLRMPLGVSGLRSERLAKVKHSKKHPWVPRNTYRMGAVDDSDVEPDIDSLVAGGNLAASLSYGHVTMAGVGTTTSVCDDHLVGFGHPMTFRSRTSMNLHPADAIYIQEDSLGAPYKVANLGAPVGTITDDHLTGISGVLGTLPETSTIDSHATYESRERTWHTDVSVPQSMAPATFYQLFGLTDRVIDGYTPGSELLSWTIEGHQGGDPFSLAVEDRYASDYDIAFEAAYELADFVWALSVIPGVTIDSVSTDAAIDDDNGRFRVRGLEQYRRGTWYPVKKGEPALARVGRKLVLRVVLVGPTSTERPIVRMMVPSDAMPGKSRLEVLGGNSMWSELSYPRSVAQAEKFVDTLVRNDQVQVSLSTSAGRSSVTTQELSAPAGRVVDGRKALRVRIR